jgi:DNA-binding MarR family transcriptional regulator
VEASCGIGDSKLWLLWEISHSPSARVSELARKLGVHVSTCSNLLDALQKHGLIQRDRGEQDHRQVKVRLTMAGERLLANAPKPAQGALNAALGRMPLIELQNLHASLTQLVQKLGQTTPTLGQIPLDESLSGEKT